MALSTRVVPLALAAGLAVAGIAGCGSGGSSKLPDAAKAGGAAAQSAGAAASDAVTGGDTPADPQAALAKGLDGLSGQQALDVVAKIDADADALVAADAADPTSTDKLTKDEAEMILGGDFEIISKSTNGAAIGEAKDAVNTAFIVHGAGTSLFEVRSIAGTSLYAKADVDKILELSHTSRSTVDQQLSAVPPQFAFVKDAAAGKWLKIDLAGLKGLAAQIAPSAAAAASADPSQAAAATSALVATLKKDVTATKGPDSDKGDHLVLTTNARTLVKDFVGTISSFVPGGSSALGQFKPEDTPDKTVTLDAYLKDGTLSELELDIKQFLEPKDATTYGDKQLALDLVFKSEADDVKAPDDATTVDLQGLLGGLLGGLGTASGSSSGTVAPVPTSTP